MRISYSTNDKITDVIDLYDTAMADQSEGNMEMLVAEDLELIENEDEKIETCRPAWLEDKGINDVIYCDMFVQRHLC